MPIVFAVSQQPWWPMCGNGPFWGWGWGMMLFWLIALVAIAAVVWRLVGARGGGLAQSPPSAEEILKARYARGEIDRETYTRMLGDLRTGPRPNP
jgi:putative membrane protein